MRASRILLILLGIFLAGSLPLSRESSFAPAHTGQAAQTSQVPLAAPQTETAQSDPPGTIDGSKNPELIPDDVAYRLVLLAIAEPENATEDQKARFLAKIGSAELDAGDTQGLFDTVATFQKQMDALNAQSEAILARDPIPLPETPDFQALVGLSKQSETVFNQTISALPAKLSADGATKFLTYVRNAKRGMKHVPDMPMTKP